MLRFTREEPMRRWSPGLLLAAIAVSLIVATPITAGAQSTGKVWKIGILEPFHAALRASLIDTFRQGLRQLGYEEGHNFVFEARFADGQLERLPELAAELVKLNVDVIVASSTQAIRAAQQATKTIPIIMTTVGDPIGPGFVASLAKPGGNITGLTIQAPELIAKRLQLLKEAVPQMSRVAVVWDSRVSHEVEGFKEAERAAPSLGLTLLSFDVKQAEDLEPAFAAMARDGANGLLVFENAITVNNSKRIVDLAFKHRLPGAYGLRDFADAGGLMVYGPVRADNYRRAAIFVDKIVKGAKPSDLPVEQPTKFELVINLKAAKANGLTITPSLLLRADQLIE
jgi:putative ABC transport system substrate-binding protein